MADKGDYALIVGRTNGLEPSPVNGRGLVKGNPPLEFQTALPAEGESEIERTIKINQPAVQYPKAGQDLKPSLFPSCRKLYITRILLHGTM